METFKQGDTVTHPVHGKGDVLDTYPELKLVEVYFYFAPAGPTVITVHPVSLTKGAS